MTLGEIRKGVDAIDSEILELLVRRADLVHEIGKLKQRDGLAIYAPEREEKLLRSLLQRNRGRLPERAIRAIFREIMSASLALEKALTIAYLGPGATWTHHAAREKFGASVEYAARSSIADVFHAVTTKAADYGVVPMDHAPEGIVEHALDIFVNSDLKICAQIPLKTGGVSGILQRFLVIGPDSCPETGTDETSVMFAVSDHPGGLVAALEVFQKQRVSVNRIESRGSLTPNGPVLFFADVGGHADVDPLKKALTALEARASTVKVLGSYPRATG